MNGGEDLPESHLRQQPWRGPLVALHDWRERSSFPRVLSARLGLAFLSATALLGGLALTGGNASWPAWVAAVGILEPIGLLCLLGLLLLGMDVEDARRLQGRLPNTPQLELTAVALAVVLNSIFLAVYSEVLLSGKPLFRVSGSDANGAPFYGLILTAVAAFIFSGWARWIALAVGPAITLVVFSVLLSLAPADSNLAAPGIFFLFVFVFLPAYYVVFTVVTLVVLIRRGVRRSRAERASSG